MFLLRQLTCKITFPATFYLANCNFDGSNQCGYKQQSVDDFDWVIRQGSTPSSETGPSKDVNGRGMVMPTPHTYIHTHAWSYTIVCYLS